MTGPTRQLVASLQLGCGSRELLLIHAGWAGSITGELCYEVGVALYAYDAGGATAVAVVALGRSVISAVTVPFSAGLGDRFPRRAVLVATNVVLVAALAAMAVGAALDIDPYAVYALTGVVAVAVPAFRPVQLALLPHACGTPAQLTSANALVTMSESAAGFVGPALAAVLLATWHVAAVFAAAAALCAFSAVAVKQLPAEADAGEDGAGENGGGGDARDGRGTLLGGFRIAAGDRSVRGLLVVYTGAMLAWGAFFQVLVFVVAIELLDVGDSGAAFMLSLGGVGGVLGAIGALALVGRPRLMPALTLGVALWTAGLVAIAGWHAAALAYAATTAIGFGVVLIDVVVWTLLQRAIADEYLARVFGVLESVMRLALGLGSVMVPLLVAAAGVQGALVAIACVMAAAGIVAWRPVTALDRAAPPLAERLGVLRAVPFFRLLPAPSAERLAGRMAPVEAAPGDVVIAQGDPGDRFFIVAEGRLVVRRDGVRLRELGPRDFFGEIALLQDVARTADVAVEAPARLYALERDDFLDALASHPPLAAAAGRIASARLHA